LIPEHPITLSRTKNSFEIASKVNQKERSRVK
jgi:hypothetical protein